MQGVQRGTQRRIVLHIGAFKTGTTFLQQVMVANKQRLAGAGVLFPGRTWSDQVYAVKEAIGRTTKDPVIHQRCVGKWNELATSILAHRGTTSVLSMEYLAAAKPRAAQSIVESLTSEGTDVHVVLTVRDADAMIPSAWQTSCRSGGQLSWPDYVDEVMSVGRSETRPRSLRGRRFRRNHDVLRVIRTWGKAVPPENTHVVTVPRDRSDPWLLWRRFADAAGVESSTASDLPRRDNSGLGLPSAHLLASLNREIHPMRRSDYNAIVNKFLSRKVLALRSASEPKARLHRPGRAFAAYWNARTRWAIEDSGVHLVGTLADLPTEPRDIDQTPLLLPPTPESELLDAATDAYRGLVDLIDQRRIDQRRQGPRRRRTRPGRSGESSSRTSVARYEADPPLSRWRSAPDAVAAAVTDIAELVNTATELRQVARRQDGNTTPRGESDVPTHLGL